jgi:hypothetical protein
MAGHAAGGCRGMVWVCGGCLPLAEKLPLLPVAAALADLCRLDGGELLAAALGMSPPYVRAEVERLLPHLEGGGPGRRRQGRGLAAGSAVFRGG